MSASGLRIKKRQTRQLRRMSKKDVLKAISELSELAETVTDMIAEEKNKGK